MIVKLSYQASCCLGNKFTHTFSPSILVMFTRVPRLVVLAVTSGARAPGSRPRVCLSCIQELMVRVLDKNAFTRWVPQWITCHGSIPDRAAQEI